MEPVRIGWLGACLDGPGGGYDKIHRLAFDEGLAAGVLSRPYEFVVHPENGLPRGSAKNAIDSFRHLVDEGCIAVAGGYSSDNAMVLAEYANAAKVPLVSWCGTDRFHGEYCFRLGNGDCGGDATLVVAWLARHGHRRVAVLSEVSPNGEEYFRYFRQECRRRDVSMAAVETVAQTTTRLAEHLARLRDARPDALVYMGYGLLAASGALRAALDALAWDPPRIMGTSFMFYLRGFEKFEGWVGIDQLHPDNRLATAFHDRFVARHGTAPPLWPNAIPVLAYDTARLLVEALHRAPVLTGWGVKAGLESIRFLPSATGGPHTHIAGGPHDHQLFKGDWLLYGRIRQGKLEFDGLFEPWE